MRLHYSTANTVVPQEMDQAFFEFPLEAADALEFLLTQTGDGSWRPVRLLPGLEPEDQLNIARMLFNAGVLLCRTDDELRAAAASASAKKTKKKGGK